VGQIFSFSNIFLAERLFGRNIFRPNFFFVRIDRKRFYILPAHQSVHLFRAADSLVMLVTIVIVGVVFVVGVVVDVGSIGVVGAVVGVVGHCYSWCYWCCRCWCCYS